MSQEKSSSQYRFWPAIIQSVQTPLGFFVLIVLVLNLILIPLAYLAEPSQRTWFIAAIIFLLFLLIISVMILAIFRPEALKGLRPASIPVLSGQVKSEQDAKIQQLAQESSVNPELIDSKLVRFIPPLAPTQFTIVRFLDQNPPIYFDYPFAPTGMLIIYQIPFFLLPVTDSRNSLVGHSVIDLQPGNYNEPGRKKLDVSIDNAKCVHFLISAGHGWRMHEGIQFLFRRIGYLTFSFKEGIEQKYDLVLGKHLREWAFGNSTNLVTELDLSCSKPAWLSHDSTKRFDLLTVPINNSSRNLCSIEIVAEFEESHPYNHVKTPAIIISAITVERSIF